MARGPEDDRIPPVGTREATLIGHNGGPSLDKLAPLSTREWLKLVGPRVAATILPFRPGARWTAFMTERELRRLAKLEARTVRRLEHVAQDRAEQHRLMRRGIARMRRRNGKT